MSGGNLNKEIFLNTVKSDASNGTSNAKAMLLWESKYGLLGLIV